MGFSFDRLRWKKKMLNHPTNEATTDFFFIWIGISLNLLKQRQLTSNLNRERDRIRNCFLFETTYWWKASDFKTSTLSFPLHWRPSIPEKKRKKERREYSLSAYHCVLQQLYFNNWWHDRDCSQKVGIRWTDGKTKECKHLTAKISNIEMRI